MSTALTLGHTIASLWRYRTSISPVVPLFSVLNSVGSVFNAPAEISTSTGSSITVTNTVLNSTGTGYNVI